ncbi:MAG TPA: hypothetical protein VE422_31360 [Terriglobia bacterium]|nr:hypothetical protein [Terriglobia bacterium]
MYSKRRILKTGVLAIVMTIAFASFAFRVEEWTKALRSDFVVLGQTGTGGGSTGSSGGGGGTSVSVTKILPQIAIGTFDGNLTKYSTVIEIVNTNSTPVTVSGNFYNTNGSPSTVAYATNLTASPTITGSLPSTTLGARSVIVITGNTSPTYAANWAKITATGAVSIATFFEIRDGATNALSSRVGVNASPANMSKFVMSRVHSPSLELAFALVNTGAEPAVYTATLRDVNGNTIATKTESLGALSQTAKLTDGFFGLTNQPAGTSYSFITFESSSAAFGAIAVSFEGASQTSFPVDQLQ